MLSIYKLTIIGGNVLLPKGARIMSCQVQFEDIQLWFLTNVHEKELENRRFEIYTTGCQLPDDINELTFLATVQMYGGNDVYHVFERPMK